MLQTIKLYNLRNGEFLQFFIDAITISLKFNTEELGIKEQINSIISEIESFKSIYGQNRGSDISDELKDIDIRRDNCITGIRIVLEGYKHHYNTAFSEAATILLNKIDSFGSAIARQNYQIETSSINGIINSFNKEENLSNAILTLSLTDWINKMDEENKLFNRRYLDRIDEASKQSEDKVKELRKTTIEKYRIFSNHLTAHITLKGEESYKPISDQLNELIDKYNLIISRRVNTKTEEEAETSAM
ncbi:MAG: hypothetical protein JXR51_16445 [Bacteroidales bacterium]|nr:hypothetical protein [Bacteroidales bacterium]MBN2758757.1 hypothetical protein [Bacteroidales bacterium]